MISFISSFEIINVVIREAKSKGRTDPKTFFWIAAADAAAVNPNGIKTLLANDFSTFQYKSKPVFSNGPKSLPTNPFDCPILWNWVFDNFIIAEEPFAKALWSFETMS